MNKLLLAFVFLVFSSFVSAADIQLTRDIPTEREDGSQIQSIDKFVIYYSVDNVSQSTIEVDPLLSGYTIPDVAEGSHTFQISTIAGGLEGTASDPVNVDITASKPIKIELTVRVVE